MHRDYLRIILTIDFYTFFFDVIYHRTVFDSFFSFRNLYCYWTTFEYVLLREPWKNSDGENIESNDEG